MARGLSPHQSKSRLELIEADTQFIFATPMAALWSYFSRLRAGILENLLGIWEILPSEAWAMGSGSVAVRYPPGMRSHETQAKCLSSSLSFLNPDVP